ncbi:ATP-grasp domain-containing protein [Fluoribacter dumoffii]|uniref:Carbamoyl-phosphate synthase large chain n=1 Tax=Fluoribacter dumoffii TaxID=463 RepID=A0A377G9I4_9GAMM|nr:ATP-grasp domain-containing protein [Fluoribacter dumoffii]KTC90264.1 Carbamoyl-phosphate synthase large chain [Fluoribacter dumoffii NY 23]MCW8385582.1 ATP-grasp domain-containing protein [Fluoribacter dumoffii]MCW8418609.1 ATP-grasp domain-containing protein [Fluoribacter dumoffii]MCW8453547.1 ATP-grasp domain-containing protein [Fluoribacter dumoffii]MCW8459234.1 ATP-grasp domain-containing protein [Fluoribacter dumoffii]
MNILIMGGRAPATLDIMRSLMNQGYQVYSAESMLFPLARCVKGIKKHFVIPKPNQDLSVFLKAVKDIVIQYKIDLLIPTCEEIFYISQGYEDLSKHTKIFAEPFERLEQLHNKFSFNQLVKEYGLNAPQSWLITTDKDKQTLPADRELVLKPVFPIFGSRTLIKPTPKAITDLAIKEPYIAQQFIQGKEYSAYAIAHKGEVLIQSCYHSVYNAGRSTGIYFEPAEIKPINEFIKTFCKRFQFSGQIAFDFIIMNEKAYVLECNPRLTSGFHFLTDKIDWHTILSGQRQYDIPNMQHMQPFMLGQGMLIYSLKYLLKKPGRFVKDYRRAHDVLKNKAYPWLRFKSTLTMLNVLCRAIRVKKGIYLASTYDIDFNGNRNPSG